MYNLRMSMYVTGPNGFSLRDLAAFIYGWKNILYKNKVMTILECLKIDFNFFWSVKYPMLGIQIDIRLSFECSGCLVTLRMTESFHLIH